MYQEQLGAIGKAVDDGIARLQADNAALSGSVAALQTQVAQLQKDLNDCRNPTPAYTLHVGMATEPNTFAQWGVVTAKSGPMTYRRTYKPPGAWKASWADGTAAADVSLGVKSAHTMKGTGNMKESLDSLLAGHEDGAILQYLKGAPDGTLLQFLHEPEDDFRNNNWNPALYRQGQQYMRRLIDRANVGRAKPMRFGGCLMASSAGSAAEPFWPGPGTWDHLGWDGYNWPQREGGPVPSWEEASVAPSWKEASVVFNKAVTFTKNLGVDFAIFEIGCRRGATKDEYLHPSIGDEMAQTQWIKNARLWMRDVAKPISACYFDHLPMFGIISANGYAAWGHD